MYLNYSGLKLLLSLSFAFVVSTSCNKVKESESQTSQQKAVNPKVDKLKLQAGFQAEHLYSPSENEQGSWVSMTFDNKGRLIASDQYGSLYRLTIPPIGSDSVKPKVEKLSIDIGNAQGADTTKSKVQMGYAQGLLWAFNSLYVMVNHRGNEDFERGSGLYRMQDTNQDDQFDKITLLKSLEGEGEHGPHSIVLAPDKNSLYVMAGNFTNIPKMDAYRLPPVWNEDNLFPLIKDPRGHATDRTAPGGWLANVDSLGKRWELVSAGFRNSYDMAFNESGDLFTFDSDMEWDLGMPWYKPTRILHITSGSEFGWRTGSISWSPTFPDNLPGILNMGQGSPTGVFHGKDARFPDKYKKSLFAFDWSFGIIYAIHLQPEGASYRAEAEEFISGTPLPLTDGVIGPDGALYFATGGRKLESDLYRVYYSNKDEKKVELASYKASGQTTESQQLRKKLETYHGKEVAGAVDAAWPHLKHEDRYIRYAARIAVENQPLSQWQDRALQEKDPQALTQAMIALARHGKKELRNQMAQALTAVNYEALSETGQQDMLRAFELIFYRMGMPDAAVKSQVIGYLNPHYPANTNTLNRGLSKLLVYLEAPQVAEKTLALLEKAEDDKSATVTESSDLILRNPQYGLDIAGLLEKMPPAQQTYYATVLSSLKSGWTPQLHEKYFKWYQTAFNYQGGNSYIGFVNKAREAALSKVPKAKFAYYNTLSGDSLLSESGNDLGKLPRAKGPGRNWKMEDALPLVENGLVNRNFEQGKMMFAATRCISCHNMRGEGRNIGPDLTQLGTRFSSKDMLDHIINPNKEVSDQYAATIFYMKDGNSVLGRLTNEDKENYFISQNPFAPDMTRKIAKKDVANTKYSSVSIMLPGLINGLNEEELKDLMAYLMAGGNKDHQVYSASNTTNAGDNNKAK